MAALKKLFDDLSDAKLAVLIGTVLFALGAWPLVLTRELPYQDLPNHLATAHIIAHLGEYPEIAFNGFARTNSALVGWLVLAGPALGLSVAAKVFTAVTLAATAFALPWFVLELAGRARMRSAAFVAWPLVHHWFVSMGMLNFALAIPLGMALLVALRRQQVEPSFHRGAVAALLAVLVWYAHTFVLAIVALLVGVSVATRATWTERVRDAKALLAPLVPGVLCNAVSLLDRLSTQESLVQNKLRLAFYTPADLVQNVWSDYAAAFTARSITSLATTIALAVYAWKRRKETPTFFGPWALGLLAACFCFLPHNALNWGYMSSRFLPFLYLAALLRVPDSLNRRARALFATCAIAYSASLGVDYVRLDGDRALFTAGMDAVAEGAKLLPVVFAPRVSSDNTLSLLHAWGYYVVAKSTSAPLVFAESRSYPITWKTPPPAAVRRAQEVPMDAALGSEDLYCRRDRSEQCHARWRLGWGEFWLQAAGSFDTLLLWRAPPGVLATMPRALFWTTFDASGLLIVSRRSPSRQSP